MNKKKLVVLTLLVTVMFTLASCMLVACNPNTDDGTDDTKLTATEGLLLSNGDFKVVDTTVKTYPRTITGWSGAKMYNGGSYRDDVIAGAVNLSKNLYDANKATWSGDENSELYDKLIANGRYGDNDDIKNALMIYMPEQPEDKSSHGPTAYGFTSTSFTLDKGSYYVLSVDVLTYNIGGNDKKGARIYVSSNTYAEFDRIDTRGEWQTYTIYIESSPTASTSLSVMLSLGKASSNMTTDGLTTGYVFFDNVSLKKLTTDAVTGDAALSKQQVTGKTLSEYFAERVNDEKDAGKRVATATLKVPNGNFDFGTLSPSSSGTPSSWSVVNGNSNQTDAAPTSLGKNSIIDLNIFKSFIGDENSDRAAILTAMKNDSVLKNLNRNYALALSGVTGSSYDTLDDINNHTFLENLVNGNTNQPDQTKGNNGKNNAFVLSQASMTAQGIRSSRTITFEKGKIYELSIWIYAYKIHGEGVTLKLTGSDGKDIIIKGIANNKNAAEEADFILGNHKVTTEGNDNGTCESYGSTSGWTQYSFFIKGNQYKDYSYNMEIWLGTEGISKNTAVSYKISGSSGTTYTDSGSFSNGWVFIDDLKLSEISQLPSDNSSYKATDTQTLDISETKNATFHSIAVDLSTAENKLKNFLSSTGSDSNIQEVLGEGNDLAIPDWTTSFDASNKEYASVKNNVKAGRINLASSANFSDNGFGNLAAPELPYDLPKTDDSGDKIDALAIYAKSDSYFEVTSKSIEIAANHFYRISFWLKTDQVKSTSGAYVTLLNITKQQENADKNNKELKDEDEVQLTSFTRINTAGVDEYLNDWVEINIIIRGAQDKATDVALKFALGTGNRWATSTLASGAMYVTNFNMADLTYANFNSTTTGTYTKTVNLTDTYDYSSRISNGNFDEFDPDDEDLDFSGATNLLSQQNYAAKPLNWTISDSAVDINKKDDSEEAADIFAGIVQFNKDNKDGVYNASSQVTAVTGENDTLNNFFGAVDSQYQGNEEDIKEMIEKLSGPNVLTIGTKNAAKAAIGFTSDSFTLSANTYYKLSIYTRAMHGATASIFLTGEAAAEGNSKFIVNTQNATNWTKFTFYIEVGKTSVSVRLNLWLGQDAQYMDKTDDKQSDEEFKESLKSGGLVFFDNILLETLEENEYNKFTKDLSINETTNTTSEQEAMLSFMTDSFDSLSTTTESRATLSSPSGWTGAAGTNQSASNSKAGIVYADQNYYGTKGLDDTTSGTYADLFGRNYSTDDSDITVTDTEQSEIKKAVENKESEATALYGSYFANNTWDDAGLIEAIRKHKVEELKRSRWIPYDELNLLRKGNKGGKQILVINNMTDSAYTYTSSSNTLKANSFYEISVWVRTYGILTDSVTDKDIAEAKNFTAENEAQQAQYDAYQACKKDHEWDLVALRQAIQKYKYADDKAGAFIELYLGSAYDTDKPLIFESIIDSEWTQYKFVVQTQSEDVTSVTIRLSLGKYMDEKKDGETIVHGLTSGYAMFDDVTLRKVDLTALPEENDVTKVQKVSYSDDLKPNTEDEENNGGDTTETNNFNLDALWWMIPTIVLGVIIIAVVVVLIVRKLRKKAGVSDSNEPKKVTVAAPTQTLDEKHDKYDEDKE